MANTPSVCKPLRGSQGRRGETCSADMQVKPKGEHISACLKKAFPQAGFSG